MNYESWLSGLGVDVGFASKVEGEYQDVGPNGLNGVSSGAMWDPTGGPGEGLTGCFEFYGASDYVEIPHNASIAYSSADTVTHGVWVKIPSPSSSQSYATVFSKGSFNYELRHRETTHTTLGWNPGAYEGVHDYNAPSGEWVFYVTQHESVGSDVTLRIFRRTSSDSSIQLISDKEVTTSHIDSYARGGTPGTANLCLGAREGTDRFFHGFIAGYFSVSSILTIAQMNEGYNSAFSIPDPGLVYDPTAVAYTGFDPDPVPVRLHLGNEFSP